MSEVRALCQDLGEYLTGRRIPKPEKYQLKKMN